MRRCSTLALAATFALAACGGGSDAASNDDADNASSGASDEPATEDNDLVDDLPQFLSDFDRVCTTGTGFGGATALSEGPGPHPFVLMQESDDGYIFERNLSDAPAGWNIQTDGDFDDNSEIQPTEIIACSQRAATSPTGIMCDLEGDDGSVSTLEMVDVTFEITMREATTGTAIGTETVEAIKADCPSFVFVHDEDTQYFNTPTEDQYINAVKAYVAPDA